VELTLSRHGRAMGEAAVTLATTGHAAAIVAVTRQGKTAQLLSALRPRAAIIAVTASDTVARRLALNWGVTPIVSPHRDLGELQAPLRETAQIPVGSVVVFVNISQDLSRVDANFVNVQQLGG
jgi:pyruvate kinase